MAHLTDPYNSPRRISTDEIKKFLEDLEDTVRWAAEDLFGDADFDLLDELIKVEKGEENQIDEFPDFDSFFEENSDSIQKIIDLRDIVEELPRDAYLILDDDFEQYAREYFDETRESSKPDAWPYNCIDWEKAARELQSDFSSIDIDDSSYFYQG